jgi:hypothetical protein
MKAEPKDLSHLLIQGKEIVKLKCSFKFQPCTWEQLIQQKGEESQDPSC